MVDDRDADDRRKWLLGNSQKPSEQQAPPAALPAERRDNLCGVSPVISNSAVQLVAAGSSPPPPFDGMPFVPDGLYTTGEAADIFRISSKTLRTWVSNGVFLPSESWRENRTRRVFTGAGIRRLLGERRAAGAKHGPLFPGQRRRGEAGNCPANTKPTADQPKPGDGSE